MLDRTLRDAGRTKRVTGYKVVGAVPSLSASRYGGLTKTYVQHSASGDQFAASFSGQTEISGCIHHQFVQYQ